MNEGSRTIDSERHGKIEQGYFLRNLLLFGRLLRGLGVAVTLTQILDMVEALKYVKLHSREDFKNSARALLINKHVHLPLFDLAFDLFWQARDEERLIDPDLGKLSLQTPEQHQIVEFAPLNDEERKSPERESSEPFFDTIQTYSTREVLRKKDFAELTPAELQEIKQLIQSMNWNLELRRTRRKTRATRKIYLDLRRGFRQNLRYGGETLRLMWRDRKLKCRPLVAICDISGSMERYSRVLLKFIYALSNGPEHVEAFVFSTRLTRITHQLRGRDIDEALEHATASIHDWAGGTRIGEVLKTFNFRWGRRVLGQGAVVLVISDGWDRGDPLVLGHELSRLQLTSHRLIWLNPLLGSANYEPLTRGMKAALPYIDDFLPVHNLESLEQLAKLFQRLERNKPVQSQLI